MSRIRSVHPGFHTDEAIVSCSFQARLFLIGLWNESDDYGVFEWKPLTLKMRLFPADNVNPNELLDELLKHNLIKLIEKDGAKFGICKNFCAYQRPKKPTSKHNLHGNYTDFIGLKFRTTSPLVPNRLPTSGEKSPQMEKEKESKESNTPSTTVLSKKPTVSDNAREFKKTEALDRLLHNQPQIGNHHVQRYPNPNRTQSPTILNASARAIAASKNKGNLG